MKKKLCLKIFVGVLSIVSWSSVCFVSSLSRESFALWVFRSRRKLKVWICFCVSKLRCVSLKKKSVSDMLRFFLRIWMILIDGVDG